MSVSARTYAESAAESAAANESAPPEPPRALMRELPPADPFPADALGSVLGSAAAAIHDKTQAPVAICSQSVLAAGTLAVQGHNDVVLPTEQARPISNYFLSIAQTGERKSAADGHALRPIRERESAFHTWDTWVSLIG